MSYLLTYGCNKCGRCIERSCQIITRESPPWAYLDYCPSCQSRQTFLRDGIYNDDPADPPSPIFSLPISKTLPITTSLYLMKSENGLHKIGISNDVDRRLQSLSTGPVAIELLWSKEMPDAAQVESDWHITFQAHRVRGEWFDLDENQVARFINENEGNWK